MVVSFLDYRLAMHGIGSVKNSENGRPTVFRAPVFKCQTPHTDKPLPA